MDKDTYKVFETKMEKAISVLKQNLSALRAGRANPAILDRITVEYYGTPTPINQLANISVPEARVIVIQPWDTNLLKDIEKAIQKSDIGINPSNDGKIIRLVFPVPTEERRRELVKSAKKYGEEAKVAIRAVRRDAIEGFKVQKKKSEITEDDLRTAENDMQKITDKFIGEVDRIVSEKEKDIMEV